MDERQEYEKGNTSQMTNHWRFQREQKKVAERNYIVSNGFNFDYTKLAAV